MATKFIRRYPEPESRPAPMFILDEEPDILETAGGYCPNYDKLLDKGFTVEEALIWCNMD